MDAAWLFADKGGRRSKPRGVRRGTPTSVIPPLWEPSLAGRRVKGPETCAQRAFGAPGPDSSAMLSTDIAKSPIHQFCCDLGVPWETEGQGSLRSWGPHPAPLRSTAHFRVSGGVDGSPLCLWAVRTGSIQLNPLLGPVGAPRLGGGCIRGSQTSPLCNGDRTESLGLKAQSHPCLEQEPGFSIPRSRGQSASMLSRETFWEVPVRDWVSRISPEAVQGLGVVQVSHVQP